MAAEKHAIEVENLECRYGNRTVLRDVSFHVWQGELFFVAGTNGSGKSTLLRHLLGLEAPTSGRIRYSDQEFTQASPATRRKLLQTFGVLFQNNALWSSMTLLENVALPLELRAHLDKATREELVRLKLAQVGLAGQETRYPRELSGGMKKRAALARALALDPEILFLDEPTAGLDPITSRKINRLIADIRESMGATIVIVSHSLASITQLADRLILLDRTTGGIVAEGTPQELVRQKEPRLVREFLRQDHFAFNSPEASSSLARRSS